MDIGGQAVGLVVEGERAAVPTLEEIEGRSGQEKVRRVDRVASLEVVYRGGEGLRLLEDERVADVVDV